MEIRLQKIRGRSFSETSTNNLNLIVLGHYFANYALWALQTDFGNIILHKIK